MKIADIAVVGGGIVGLAFAYAHARRGRRVVLFERHDFVIAASVRNFGLVWPIGQAQGTASDRALRSRAIWIDIIQKAGLWHTPSGSLHLAYAEDELSVLQEYLAASPEKFQRELLTPKGVLDRSHWVRPEGLVGGLWSPTEMNVDPRQAVRTIPLMLEEQYGVQLCFGTTVREISLPNILTTDGTWQVNEAVVCSGSDFETLYPELLKTAGLKRCKLQMLRTIPFPNGWELGPCLCGGLTLLHYDCFSECSTLPALRERLQHEFPLHRDKGIHVLISQTAFGELTIGDSHEYADTLEPFDQEDINAAILSYLGRFARFHDFAIAERWHGIYSKSPSKTEFVGHPANGVSVVTGLGGAGMTLSFGLAEDLVSGNSTG